MSLRGRNEHNIVNQFSTNWKKKRNIFLGGKWLTGGQEKERLYSRTWVLHFYSVQSLSHVRLFATPWITACQASLSITNSRSSLRFPSIKSVMPSIHLILYHPLLLLPPIPPSIRFFSNESTLCMRWPNNWSFSFSTSPSNEHPGLISFRMDWSDLSAAQGTLKSFLQCHGSKASILWHSAFFTVQLSLPSKTYVILFCFSLKICLSFKAK